MMKRRVHKSGKPAQKSKPVPNDWPSPREHLWARAEQASGLGSVARADQDAALHILKRRLPMLEPKDHFRYVELTAGRMVSHLRAVRDECRQFLKGQSRRALAELQWRVFRFGVLEVAVYVLRFAISEYLVHARVPIDRWEFLFDPSGRMMECVPDTPGSTPAF